MAIYKRGEIWWINLYRSGRPRLQVSSGTGNELEARAIEATLKRATRGNPQRERLIAALDNLLDAPEPVSVALDQVWRVYSALPDIPAARLLRHRRSHVLGFVAWSADNWPAVKTMAGVDRQCAFAYMDSLRGSVAGKTYNNIRGNLSAVWQSLMIRAELTENVWRLTPTASQADSRSRRAFSRQEEKRILFAAKKFPFWEQICIVARHTGLRRGDILALRWSDIGNDFIRITPSKTKRHRTRITIPLHDRVKTALAELPHDSELLFPGVATAGGEKRGAFAQILKAATVTDDKHILDFHCWRHTFRTRLRDAGVPEDICNKLGGWSDAGAGERYDHSLEPLKAAIAADQG